ncbi:L-fucose:H+ symporter permease [Reichenbachiella agarivorans]|uniref:L-fucose:H+ symporter permease n=1 Tax=Reichenbachiella agarivorans TaxID=2979464 RepID=A0ABY6CQ45_9BACT|nr:L-fucose:H+ symporter permease [Reichenbachiella agarivorans]UXP32627.1 L-fucose:H+ symporter permease [Reichenbachiella agarivorans]
MMMKNDKVVSRQILLPFILITSLFALWGFANAVTDPMVSAFKKVLELNNLQASLVQLAFYGGYFTMALPASMFIRKFSYKTGILIGLGLYATGALLFYPAAVTEQFGFFLIGLYVLTFGLAFLETTANPYILSMGSKETATRRLNLAQSFNPVGLIGGLLVAQNFVLAKLKSDDVKFSDLSETAKTVIRQSDLMVIRDPYVVLGLVVIGVFILIVISNMPESKDEDDNLSTWEIIKVLIKKPHYAQGVLAQAFYVGVQIMCWTYIYQYAESMGVDGVTAGSYQFAAFILFFVGRFLCTYLLRFINSGRLLALLSLLAIVFTLGTIFIQGIFGLYCLVTISFCMSLMFPTIYGIALEGLTEDESKIGAAGLVMAIVGGALMPAFQGMILDLGGDGYADVQILGVSEVNFSFVLPLLCFVFIASYGIRVMRGKI